MKIKTNKRTLRKRIRRYILLSFLTTTFIFIGVIGYLGIRILNPFITHATSMITNSIGSTMNSPDFLQQHKINSLTEFNENSLEYKYWYKNLDTTINLKMRSEELKLLSTPLPNNPMNTPVESDLKASSDPVDSDFLFVFIEIKIKDRVLYSNLKDNTFLSTTSSLNPFSHLSTSILVDEKNAPIGTVKGQINPLIIGAALTLAFGLLLIAFIISFIAALIISRLSSIPIIKPITELERTIHAISNENFECTINQQILLKKPLKEIESIANATNEIMHKMKTYTLQSESQNKILESQNIELESQNTELIESKLQIEKAQEALAQKEMSVRMLLDNAGQGFLSFGPNLFIHEEYSTECISILGKEIKNVYFPQLFFYGDKETKNFMESVLKRILSESDSGKKELYLPLLVDEIKINNKTIHISYKLIHDKAHNEEDLMVILTDITDKRNLETVIEEERNILKMVVKVVVNYGDFMEILTDYTCFCREELPKMFDKGYTLNDILSLLYRQVHTFKGNFSQIYMNKIVKNLHDIESNLTDIKKEEDSISIEDLKVFIEDCAFESLLEEDLAVLKEVLGHEFFNREQVILIDKQRFIEIEKKMISILSPFECKLLLPHLRSLRYKPMKELLCNYSDYIEKLAGNLSKLINPMQIEGDTVLVDDTFYHNFTKSLVHVFRNILDHGIESPEERIESGKSEYGTIVCRINLLENNALSLQIEDDGRGIDPDKILQKAIEKGICTVEETKTLSENEILSYLFYDGISTKDTVSTLSGRGIGLAAIKSEVDALNGTIEIKTTMQKGTCMEFILPYSSLNTIPEITVSSIINPLLETTVTYITKEMQLQLIPFKCTDIEKVEKLSLSKFTIFIGIKGFISGRVVLSLDKELSKIITHHFIMGDVSEAEEIELMEDAIAEFSNIVIGNSFQSFPMLEDLITMEAPVTINSENASFTSPSSQIWTSKLAFETGVLNLSFITSESIVVDG